MCVLINLIELKAYCLVYKAGNGRIIYFIKKGTTGLCILRSWEF